MGCKKSDMSCGESGQKKPLSLGLMWLAKAVKLLMSSSLAVKKAVRMQLLANGSGLFLFTSHY
jgi:hypothetical protein